MEKVKIEIDVGKFLSELLEVLNKKDKNGLEKIIIEGETVRNDRQRKFRIGDTVFVLPYTLTPLGCRRRIVGNRWGKITDDNATSPKLEEEGILYYVNGKDGIGGWEKEENLEMIK